MAAGVHARRGFVLAAVAGGAESVLAWVRRMTPVGRQVALLVCSLAGVILGAALIARWAVGLAVIADSVLGVWLALYRDDGQRMPQVDGVVSHEAVLARFRAAP
ncbi:MAG TPA: hypothetical protein DHU96_32025 [Actinobacteria bacterium]|nr:hypothetical protein [Actinomycetota bacterium]